MTYYDQNLINKIVNIGLYNQIEINQINEIKSINNIIIGRQQFYFDSHYPKCNSNSIFHSKLSVYNNKLSDEKIDNVTPIQSIDLIFYKINYSEKRIDSYCQRCNKKFIFYFIIEVIDNVVLLEKIGQFPSIATISQANIKKYQKVLINDYKDLNRAIGLFSHGIGIGSFVYLRRILENLIEEIHELEKNNNKEWDEEKYIKKRFGEKVKLFESHFDKKLIELFQPLYSILSLGVHQLSEETCLDYFPIMKDVIEIILDKKLAEKEEEQKYLDARKNLNDLNQKLKS